MDAMDVLAKAREGMDLRTIGSIVRAVLTRRAGSASAQRKYGCANKATSSDGGGDEVGKAA